MQKNNFHKNYCFLDLETTGFDPKKDSIIEISFITRNPAGKEINRIDEVVFPDKSKMSSFVSNLTGISTEELNQSGKNFSDLVKSVEEKIGDSVIIGHNIDFDINFLIANGLEFLANNPRIDTHELARILLPKESSYALEILSDKYEMSHENAHRAMSDVEANILFFDFLVEKIKKLPAEFLEEIRPILKEKSTWFARHLFLQEKGQTYFFEEKENKNDSKNEGGVSDFETPPEICKKIHETTPQNSLFIKQSDSLSAAKITKEIANKEQQALIVTSKLDFFPDIKKFPSPEVILDPEKLDFFAKCREILNNSETSFWLQAKYRHFLGFRGKVFFNLFFKQRSYWTEICLSDQHHPIFQKILIEKKEIKVLAVNHHTFLKMVDLEIFKNRTLLIDESEDFAKTLLFSVNKTWSFLADMNSPNETLSAKAQFWVTNFCQEVIKKKLNHDITPFPEKVLLDKTENFPVFADGLNDFENLKDKNELADVLLNSKPKAIRWASYFPKNGDLKINSWHPDDWRELKNKLAKFRKIFFHRHSIDNSFSFFRIFIGVTQGTKINSPFLKKEIKLTIPKDLVSVKSPEFNSYTVDKISSVFKKENKGVLAVNFSSTETLKKVFFDLSEKTNKKEKIWGESVSGGTSKIFNLMYKSVDKKNLFLMKKSASPELKKFNIKKLIIQKFIFDPPQPLFTEIEKVMKKSGLSFWEVWISPQITANLSRVIGSFPDLEEVMMLDARENSSWGKNVLKNVF